MKNSLRLIVLIFSIIQTNSRAFAQATTLPDPFGPHQWTTTIKVVGEDGNPVTGVDVNVSYDIPPPPEPIEKSYGEIKGLTDTNGMFSATHTDSSLGLGITVSKSGYYTTHIGHQFYFDKKRQNPTFTSVLKKIINPIPMYAKSLNTHVPDLDKPVGYEATWTQKVHQRKLGIHRFRVLTVTTNAMRVTSLLEACSRLKRGQPPLSRRRAPNTTASGTPPAKSPTTRIFPVAGVAADSGTMNDENITIGERHGWGDAQPFGIAAIDERQHIYIIGKTGSGKTTLLRNLILQHIALGHGVGVIDPHGDLAEELLNHIPPSRADHLVYFNPSDLEFPIGLNVIGDVPPDTATVHGRACRIRQIHLYRNGTNRNEEEPRSDV